MRLYDTARKSVVPFEPGPVVRMYVCGITPYDSTHLGHAATYLTHDIVIRRLEDLGHTVEMVRNYTDIDDPLYAKAAAMGVGATELAESEIARFRGDMEALEMRPALAEPRVSTSIPEIVDAIEVLVKTDHTYQSDDGTVYFDVSTFERFGDLSGFTTDEMVALSRERGGTPDDPHQRHPLDFVLWKPSADGEHAWDTPWGPGRPGWHIECTAMVFTNLGTTIDLHGGGSDLVFPHHECEIAQSEAISGEPFARHWLHQGMVAYHGEKMSKSLGNLVFVSELVKQADPRSIRLAVLGHHYRAGFEWHDDEIGRGTDRLQRMVAAAGCLAGPDPAPYAEQMRAALDDDLDTPTALAVLDQFAGAILDPETGDHPGAAVTLAELAMIVGVDIHRPVRERA
ncbi:MAG: cysteine--tRNA ligase [Actinomycetia bacterium]|nr:cysteine--tRNA ligase [Actinomycetes bacterium]MCP3910095.1 cysteine--tRNA ligase [Actinomycetes bacterium]MCP4084877.1 cysteine--tRNA ligase [Actinomycetes bacterium]